MQPFAHVTVTVKFETAAVVGVPESRPPGASVIPAGRLPALTVKVKGGVPALAVRVWLYDTPVVAPGSEAGRTAIVVPWIGTVAAGPALAATGTFEQSRALTVVTVSVPAPSPLIADLRSTVNSSPPVVTPQGWPKIAWSTVYEPPPLSTTWKLVFEKAASQVPA